MTSPRNLGPDQGAEPKAIWSIVVGEATQRWVERTGRRPNDFFNGLLSRQAVLGLAFRARAERRAKGGGRFIDGLLEASELQKVRPFVRLDDRREHPCAR